MAQNDTPYALYRTLSFPKPGIIGATRSKNEGQKRKGYPEIEAEGTVTDLGLARWQNIGVK